jgi:hypothetical protein
MSQADVNIEAIGLIEEYGGTDGAHHKQWLIDQILRILLEDEESYIKWLKAYCAGDNWPDEYEWDEGIAP